MSVKDNVNGLGVLDTVIADPSAFNKLRLMMGELIPFIAPLVTDGLIITIDIPAAPVVKLAGIVTEGDG